MGKECSLAKSPMTFCDCWDLSGEGLAGKGEGKAGLDIGCLIEERRKEGMGRKKERVAGGIQVTQGKENWKTGKGVE